VSVNDGSGARTAAITTGFSQGIWINAPISIGSGGGTVSITIDHTAGTNAVLSGLFLGGASAPPAPVNLVATPVSATQINLGWTAAGATSYKVERSADGSTGWTQIGTSTTTNYQDTGLTASTTYYYRLRGSNASGDSPPSAVSSATSGASLAYSQAPQGNWVTTYGADGSALLDWNQPSDLVSLPTSATLVIDHASRWQWATSGTDPRYLQSPDASTRRA